MNKLGGFFRYEFSMKGRSKCLSTDNFFNTTILRIQYLFGQTHRNFIFRCVLGAKQQDLCIINSKKSIVVQHAFSCSISVGHKEFQISFL